MANNRSWDNNLISLCGRYVDRNGSVTHYLYESLADGSRGVMIATNVWVNAKKGNVIKVKAIGNPVIKEPNAEGIYKFKQSDLGKMRLEGIDGFNLNALPCKLSPYV
jgi:hypothetical protein